MDETARFDLILLGYRNDLARERTIEFLEGLAVPSQSAVFGRDATLPLRLLGDIGLSVGLQLSGELRALGASVRLVEITRDTTAQPAEPPASAAPLAAVRPMTLLLLALLAAAAYLYVDGRDPKHTTASKPGLTVTARLQQSNVAPRVAELNDEAVALNEGKEFEAAAGSLRAALQTEPREPLLRRNLQTVLGNWAAAELTANRPDTAIGLALEALELGDEAPLFEVLGAAHAHQADWAAAEQAFAQAVALGSANPAVFVGLAKIYRQQGDRQKAVEMLQRGRAAGAAGADFEMLLDRLQREMDAEWDFSELSSPHFSIAFAEGEDRRAAQIVLASLEETYQTVGHELGHYPSTATPVVLYGKEDFHDITQAPEWTGGVYDGRIKLPVQGLREGDPVLDRTLRHEYAHVLVTQLSRGRCPTWLSEGIAIWIEEEVPGDREHWAIATLRDQPPSRLDELSRPFVHLPAERVPAAYAQSYLAVQLLLDRYGAQGLRRFLETLAEQPSVEAAFADAFVTTFPAFEMELTEELRG